MRTGGGRLWTICGGVASAVPERPGQVGKVPHDDTYNCRLTRRLYFDKVNGVAVATAESIINLRQPNLSDKGMLSETLH